MFLFHYYVNYNVIMTKNIVLISLLRGLRCNNEKKSCVIRFATTFITPWSREKCFCFFSFCYYVYYGMIMKKIFLFFISLRLSLCKYLLISNYYTHYVTDLSRKAPSQKNTDSLKNFLSQEFQWCLASFIPWWEELIC